MLTWVLLSIICLWMYQMKLDMRQSAIASDNYFSLLDSRSNGPFIITTTIHDNTATRRWHDDSCEETLSGEMLSTSSSSPITPTLLSLTTPFPQRTAADTHSSLPLQKTEDALIDKPSRPILENYGLIPLYNILASSWSDQHKHALKQVLEKVIDRMEVVWNIFRKVYHYPLDPP